MRITSKGQVTIPVEIRQRFAMLPNTEVEFVVDGGDVRVRKLAGDATRARRVRDWAGRVRGSAPVRLSTDEIMKLTRGE